MIIEKEQVVKFMQGKADKIKEFCDIDYFTKADIKAIEEMDNDKFIVAWQNVIDNILLKKTSGLTINTCVFCMCYLFNNYRSCGYGENHGFCGDMTSSWARITKKLYKKENVFSNEFYVDLLRQSGYEIDK
jgi:hypothetical protein